MHALLLVFSSLGSFSLGCLILALAAAVSAFAGAWLGAAISMGFLSGREDPGIGKGAVLGCLLGVLWTLYCIFSTSVGTAFLAALGLVVAMLVISLIIFVFFPAPPPAYDPDLGACTDDYPY